MACGGYSGPVERRFGNIYKAAMTASIAMMEKISIEKVKTLATSKGLRPAKVKGVNNAVQLTKGNPKMDPITWDEFSSILSSKGLAVYEHGGWMRIMKA